MIAQIDPKPVVKRILIALPGEPTLARDLQLGLSLYARTHGPWRFVAPLGAGGGWRFEPANPQLHIDGAVLAVIDPKTLEPLLRAGTPLVSTTAFPGVPKVTTDNDRVGRLAAEHLLSLGLRRLAFSGRGDQIYSRQRRDAFVAAANDAGVPCPVDTGPSGRSENWTWPVLQAEHRAFLQSLEFPCGLFCTNDARARQLVEAADSLGIVVPRQLAILGSDNDEGLCEMCHPPLSSIMLDGERVGFEAAALLDRLMAGAEMSDQTLLVSPRGVEQRASTDTLAIDDPHIAAALQYIRARPNHPLTIDQIVKQVPISKRTLERRFVDVVGHTIFNEIRMAQLNHVTRLLRETDWSIDQIARASAFRTAKRLGEVFRQTLGQSPTQCREAIRTKRE
jgi:LacI family transcriptional regulator